MDELYKEAFYGLNLLWWAIYPLTLSKFDQLELEEFRLLNEVGRKIFRCRELFEKKMQEMENKTNDQSH